ncbi:MAG: PQQ-binding-like beta-propeller repeat protein [Halobacteria archaeon]|nr:PQQ-binding-like beta-propeller repeat protein [Halobacteria archaeon]
MNRREFLGLATGAVSTTLAGCASQSTPQVQGTTGKTPESNGTNESGGRPDQQSRPAQDSTNNDYWITLAHDFSRTRHNPDTKRPEKGTGVTWRSKPLPGGTILSAPAVVDDTLYVGNGGGSLYSLDLQTGLENWRFNTTDGISSTPTVVNGLMYFGSYDNRLYLLDATTGKKIWAFDTGKSITSCPAVVGDTVYFGSHDGTLYALNKINKNLKWAFETGGKISSSPAVGSGAVYTASHDGKVYAVDTNDGTKLWEFEYERDDRVRRLSSPTVANGKIYVTVHFEREINTSSMTIIPKLYALDAETGEKVWVYGADVHGFSSPAVTDEGVYISRHDSKLYSLDPNDGSVNWNSETRGQLWSSPVVVGDESVYVSSVNQVYRFDSGTKSVHELGEGAVVTSPVSVAGGTVYFGGKESYSGGLIYAIGQ